MLVPLGILNIAGRDILVKVKTGFSGIYFQIDVGLAVMIEIVTGDEHRDGTQFAGVVAQMVRELGVRPPMHPSRARSMNDDNTHALLIPEELMAGKGNYRLAGPDTRKQVFERVQLAFQEIYPQSVTWMQYTSPVDGLT